MPLKTIFLLVEGPHDAEFMARLLPAGFVQRKKLTEIPRQFQKLFPETYPASQDMPITDPHPVPRFYQNGDKWLFILVGGGSKAAITLGSTLKRARTAEFIPDVVAVVVDQDQDATPIAARDRFVVEFAKESDLPVALDFSITPGEVIEGTPRRGLFVLPDNHGVGALEDILLECGEANYQELKSLALSFRDAAYASGSMTTDDLREYGQQGGPKHISKRKKAWVSSMGAILKPAAAIQNSIRENRWLEGEAINLPRVQSVAAFLGRLLA